MDLHTNSNAVLFFGSGFLTLFFNFLHYLGISEAQVFALLFVFFFSGFAGLLKAISFRENLRAFICFDITSKALSLFVPFVVAFGAKSIALLLVFIDYCFSFLIVGEILSILVCIRALKTRNKDIKEIDIYNLLIKKFQELLAKTLHLEERESNKEEKENKENKD